LASIYPEWDDINRFHNKLTSGERHIAEYLHSNLSDEWEIYVQPFLNGSRPDFILLSQEYGIIVIEVKDWSLQSYCLENNKLYVKTTKGKHEQLNPLDQAEHYSKKLKKLISPLESKIKKDNKLIREIIYFHKETQSSVEEFFPEIKKWDIRD